MNYQMLSLLIEDFHKELDHQIQYLVSGETTVDQYDSVVSAVFEMFEDETKITQYGFSSLSKGGRILKYLNTRLYASDSLAMQQYYPVISCYKSSCRIIMEENMANKNAFMSRILYFINSEHETHSATAVASCFADAPNAAWLFTSRLEGGYFSVRNSTELCVKYLKNELYINPRFGLTEIMTELMALSEFSFFFQNNLKILENKWYFMYVVCSFLEEFMPHIYLPNRAVLNYEDNLVDALRKFSDGE